MLALIVCWSILDRTEHEGIGLWITALKKQGVAFLLYLASHFGRIHNAGTEEPHWKVVVLPARAAKFAQDLAYPEREPSQPTRCVPIAVVPSSNAMLKLSASDLVTLETVLFHCGVSVSLRPVPVLSLAYLNFDPMHEQSSQLLPRHSHTTGRDVLPSSLASA